MHRTIRFNAELTKGQEHYIVLATGENGSEHYAGYLWRALTTTTERDSWKYSVGMPGDGRVIEKGNAGYALCGVVADMVATKALEKISRGIGTTTYGPFPVWEFCRQRSISGL